MLTKNRAEELLSCNFETGELIWLANYQRPDLIGSRAGWLNEGYWRVSVDGLVYYACQIVWLMAYGYISQQTIDHRDTIKANDALNNLRLVTKGQNAVNSKMNCRNTTGFKGVSYCNSTHKYRASISIDGQSKNLGRYSTPEEAHAAWASAAIEAYGAEFVRLS